MLGTGTITNPFQITTRVELQSISNNLTAHYKLMNDIDLSGTNWIPIKDSPSPFTGTLDGNFKKILNMKIVGATGIAHNGLFMRFGAGGSVKNLGLVDVDIDSKGHYTGGLAGRDYLGTFEKVCVTGTIKLTGSYNYLGGVIGQSNGSNFIDCYTNCTVTGGAGGNYGGFNGYQQSGSLVRCLALGYYDGTVNKWLSSWGAFCGNIQWGNPTYQVDVQEAHYNSTLNPKGNPVGGITPKTTAQLKIATPYSGNWSDWTFVAGEYPILVEPVEWLKETKTVTSHVEEFISSQMLDKVANKILVSSIKKLDSDLQRQIKGSRKTLTFMKDIVSGSTRAIQVVKVAAEVVTSYILPITSDVKTLRQKFKTAEAIVTSHIEGVSSEVQREIKSLQQALSFIDVIVGQVVIPNLKIPQIEAILVHMENGTLSQYLMNPTTLAMLKDLQQESEIQSSSSTSVLENQTLVEVR